VQDAFRDTGTTHIIAISGFNITIIAGLFMSVFSRSLGTRKGALVSGIGIAVYTLLVGADAAVVRAAIMGCLGLFARQVGRRQHALNSLAFTAGLMALINPRVLWDVGFQLSFAATLGLVLYADPLSGFFVEFAERILPESIVRRLVGPVGEYFLFTLAAQITTLPVMAYHFRRISLTSLIANPVILPAQPPIMILGGVALLLGTLSLPLGRILGMAVWPFVAFTIRSVELIDQIKGGVWVLGEVALIVVALYYGALIVLELKPSWAPRLQSKWLVSIRPAFILCALAIVTVIIWKLARSLPDGNMHLTMLDVNGGESLLIESPAGHRILINGGSSHTRLSTALGRRLPPFNLELDALIIASTREDAVRGLVMSLERFHPQLVLWTGDVYTSRSSRYLNETITSLNIQMLYPQTGQILTLGMDAEMEFLWVGDRGSILSLRWEDFWAILPIGADFEALEYLEFGRGMGGATILLLADSGYAPVNPPEWFESVQPELVMLSVERANDNGLPSQEVLASLEGYTLLRTDVHGWVRISTDGELLWIEVERR
jgi:competence protein ComEC